MQNKVIHFFVKLDKIHHVSEEDFKTVNWLSVDQRVKQNLNITVFKYVNNTSSYQMKEIFGYASQGRINSRNNYTRIKVPFYKTTMGVEKSLIYWSLSLEQIAEFNEKKHQLNTFKHDVKKHYLQELRMQYHYYHYHYC